MFKVIKGCMNTECDICQKLTLKEWHNHDFIDVFLQLTRLHFIINVFISFFFPSLVNFLFDENETHLAEILSTFFEKNLSLKPCMNHKSLSRLLRKNALLSRHGKVFSTLEVSYNQMLCDKLCRRTRCSYFSQAMVSQNWNHLLLVTHNMNEFCRNN